MDQKATQIKTRQSPTTKYLPVMGARNHIKLLPCNEDTHKSNLQCTSNKAEDTNNNNTKDAEFKDFDRYVPIKYTASQQQSEIRLQSSLLQILQQEIPNVRNVTIECPDCKLPHCFDCSPKSSVRSNKSLGSLENIKNPSSQAIAYEPTPKLTRKSELDHDKETKWESYIGYVKPRKCDCSKMSKKQLFEHLPAYMRITSNYDAPELPKFENCPVIRLKRLVQNAKGHEEIVHASPEVLSRKREIGTQYSNRELECLYSNISKGNKDQCFKNNEIVDLWNIKNSLVDCSISEKYLAENISTFAVHRAISLRRLLEKAPDVKEIFERECNSDDDGNVDDSDHSSPDAEMSEIEELYSE